MPDYLAHFGLQSEPFSNAPVTRFYYESEQHKQALARLLYATSSMKGLAVVIGDIGTGKTTLARRLLDALPDSEYEAALLVIIHSGVDATWLLRRIAMQLGVADPAEEKLPLLSQLYQRLVQIYESGKKAVVLIDEAQMLATRELMEEFRGLLNLEVPERKLLSFVFFGLPDIDDAMKLDPPLKQRVALKFRLEGLNREGTEHYIAHRLGLAGAQQPVFTPAALDLIHNAASGIPRLINTICDNLLLEGAIAAVRIVDAPLVVLVAENLGFSTDDPEPVAKTVARVALTKVARPAVSASGVAASPAMVNTASPSQAAAPAAAKPVHPKAPALSTTRPAPIPAAVGENAAAIIAKPVAPPQPRPPAARPPVAPPPVPADAALDTPAAVETTPADAVTKAPLKKPVNLDDIDSLLASIRKN